MFVCKNVLANQVVSVSLHLLLLSGMGAVIQVEM